MKKLYLDSALIEEIDQVIDSLAISGVTTNPSLVSKAKKCSYKDLIKEIVERIDKSGFHKHLSVEMLSLDPDEIYEDARDMRDMVRPYKKVHLCIKVPALTKYMSTITRIGCKVGVNVNATACMKHSQAMMACEAGATHVSFFYNRMKDAGLSLEEELRYLSDFDQQIICGSIRAPQDIERCWDAGADIVTAPLNIIRLFIDHHKSIEAIENFDKDIKKWLE